MTIILIKSFAAVILAIFQFLVIVTAQRALDGQSNNLNDPNAGTPQSPYKRDIGKQAWQDGIDAMITTPGDYTAVVPKGNGACAVPALEGLFPLPRCVSNLVNGLQAKLGDEFELSIQDTKKSKRKNSHMLTFWGQFANMDVMNTLFNGENFPAGIFIPSDDATYTSEYVLGPLIPTVQQESFPFNRTKGASNRNGINEVTSFLDGSPIYGVTIDQSMKVREGVRGKLKLNYDESTEDGSFGYPPVNDNGEYAFALTTRTGKNVFVDTIMLILMREHNRKCDLLFEIHGDTWSDEQYFQEARKWVIAIIQRVTSLEYLSIVLGAPLPNYSGYDSAMTPAIDTFFSTVTSRYAHSEISDVYNIVDESGYKLTELPLRSLNTPKLIEKYGVATLVLSMALQRQEEIDIFYADQMRVLVNAKTGKTTDVASLDIVRSRDRGMPLYNDAREALGLKRKTQFTEISSNTEVQERLQKAYKSVDQVESFIGGLAEDHAKGSILGELFHKSFTQQWNLIRDSDRFWFEGNNLGFTRDEINEIRNITWLSVIQNNIPKGFVFPTNIWSVQPISTFNTSTIEENKPAQDDYPEQNVLKLSEVYEIRWKINDKNIDFKITMLSSNAWFGLGFNPSDTGMIDADMIIIWNKNDSTLSINNYLSNQYERPKEDPNQFVEQKNTPTVLSGFTQVEITRPLVPPNGRPPISNNVITMIYAWNPNSNELSYHGGNRGATKVNFFTGGGSVANVSIQNIQDTRFIHGIAMFSAWGILFPASIFIVRYLKHVETYMSRHRNLQMVGGLIVITFGAAAMATVSKHGSNSHDILGLLIYSTIFLQLGLGILAIWGLAAVESASTGIVVGLKHLHFYLGFVIMILAWCQIYVGLTLYSKQFNVVSYTWRILYLIWLAVVVAIYVIAEYVYKYKNLQFLWPLRENGDKNKRLYNRIPEDVFEQLPAISWNDFNLRVMAGAHLVVAEGLVFDIHKWFKIHPGGQRILRRVIGTDITQDFFFDPTDQIVINRAFSENEKIMKQIEETKDVKSLKKRKLPQAIRPKSIANTVDLINSTTFKNSRVAMHRHSKFATAKLATLVVARISDSTEDYGQQKKDDDFNPISSMTPIINAPPTPQNNSPYIFKRYILTNIEYATRHDAENPVKKLTFQVIHPKDKLPKFLPGDYIEIMSYVNKHMVIRPYTPLQGPSDKTFTILVKIYKDGAMSQHLEKQLRNFEIAVRGPFDVADRMYTPPQVSPYQASKIPTSPIIRPSSPNSTANLMYGNSNTSLARSATLLRQNSVSNIQRNYQPSNFGLDSVYGDESYSVNGNSEAHQPSNGGVINNRVLLNPAREDQCWDTLFMVCGGTGLTPMLQLIQYHLDCADSFGSTFKLHLLCANTQISDIISMKYLDFLASTSDGKFTVTHTLTKPPPIWRGLSGHLDDNVLFNWISKNYQIPPPAIPPRVNLSQPQTPQQMMLTSSYNPNFNESLYNYSAATPPLSSQQLPASNISMDGSDGNPMRNSIQPFAFSNFQSNNEMNVLSERQEFMRMLSQDATQSCRVAVCGPFGMMEGVRRSLERIGFPVDAKVLFIQ
ncbi:16490_t:CDS:10 [Funneliformis mosseae]|uniref:16490_t:CDS:1 n=1 Tax=Funneliformis mosseae TaxID=27381 RepID=A0A9N8ZNU7_FUNMO|nr:16490_t:CDS:10 [Funneliformis mosseae]